MSDYDLQQREIASIMDAGPTTAAELAEHQIASELHSMISRLDEFCGMANNAETVDLIEREAIAIGQIHFRAGLILDFLRAKSAPKVVQFRR